MNHFKTYSFNLGGNLYEMTRPWVMGILNVTPDSFFSGSRCDAREKIEERVKQLIEDKADMIDIGGYSSRPFAEDISPDEEFSRLSQGLEIVRSLSPEAVVSIDTFRADVAQRCVETFGPCIINDISGGDLDKNMYKVVSELRVPYILMHMRGNPHTMTKLNQYDNLMVDVIRNLAEKIDTMREYGINDIIIDPGFGFSKDVKQNFEMLDQLDEFTHLEHPLLVGISRKSMIYKSLDITPEESLNGTSVLNTISLLKGANILRVHDVKQAMEAVRLVTLCTNSHE